MLPSFGLITYYAAPAQATCQQGCSPISASTLNTKFAPYESHGNHKTTATDDGRKPTENAGSAFDVSYSLDMTWLQAVPRLRHPLFARIKEELELTHGVGEENYDGLLILA